MQPRTQRQKEIFDYIRRFIDRHGYEPSYAQIARHFGISSKATIAKHIEALEKRGLIARRHANGSFALNVNVEDAPAGGTCEVPLLGRVAAGQPIDAVDESGDSIAVPRFLLGRTRPEQIYALKVSGDSMIDEHICDGDIALIENRVEARDGEIVVALVEGARATLKRLFRYGREIELRPANSQLKPIRLPATQVQVQGIFRGLLRPAI
ncbi:MAG TPA: transcriptional repressor LexA [Pyrinomonadaceae bacterium]